MKKVITEAQKREIEKFANEYPEFVDALIGYGADMHRSGIIKGACTVIVGIIGGMFIDMAVSEIKEYIREKQSEVEES